MEFGACFSFGLAIYPNVSTSLVHGLWWLEQSVNSFVVRCIQSSSLSGRARYRYCMSGITISCILLQLHLSRCIPCRYLSCLSPSYYCGLVLLPRLPPLRLLSCGALSFQNSVWNILDPRDWLPGCDEFYDMREGGGIRCWRLAQACRRWQYAARRIAHRHIVCRR